MTVTAQERPVGAPLVADGATYSLPSLPDSWHRRTEYEVDFAYGEGFGDGFDAGMEFARAVMDAGIAEAIGGAPDSAKAIVRRLLTYMEYECRREVAA